ncbi:MAG TPA: GspE/PulE family protein [bacterium]|uniref:Type II secretion system protein E n=1 Tax=candidate division TA06 bacterium ADurb.Bin417 TaxID=1852828 RepID=A0A1V5MKS8_UNCT6|nr:MAG: Type II secretion system protein E [candidate division TA06 bacterium ADurb.Bin417]HNQ35598.1 GspE/PulE family protein [bacterium]HNS48106.1 GspE/PulE family protein [bacterium]
MARDDEFIERVRERAAQREVRQVQESATAEDQTAASLLIKIIGDAVHAKATDIHLEVEETGPKLRYRVNGLLYDFPAPAREIYARLLARIKVLSDLDVTERRLPQSGYCSFNAGDRRVDLRISTFPSVFGESAAIRVLDRNNIVLGFDRLGFQPEVLAQYLKILEFPYGMILVTGPTGGGKTTTLYTSLNKIRSGRKKIITLEDPVEYHIPGVTQGQINIKAGFTFAEGLRSILRQDPNVVMIGEIRDGETANTAMQISLTGQLVFATLHTNTAPGAVTRLLEMGLEPYLVSSSLLGVINQTLVPSVCQQCKAEYRPEAEVLAEAADDLKRFPGLKFFRGQGCPRCNQTGVQGRLGLFELMVINRRLRELILSKPSVEAVTSAALEAGMLTLREDGLRKAAAGLAKLEDVVRITRRE